MVTKAKPDYMAMVTKVIQDHIPFNKLIGLRIESADPDAPQLDGVGEIQLESADRAAGYFTVCVSGRPELNARTSGVYWRADLEDLSTLDGRDDRKRAELLAERLREWKSIVDA